MINQKLKPLTIAELASRWIEDKSEKNFKYLYTEMSPRIKNFIWKLISKNVPVGSYCSSDVSQDVDDIVHETWMKVREFIERYDNQYQFNTWVFAIAQNEYRNHYKDRNRYQKMKFGDDSDNGAKSMDWFLYKEGQFTEDTESTFEPVMHNFMEKIYSEINNYPKNRGIIIDKELKKMSYEDLSKKYGESESTLKVIIHRYRKDIKRRYLVEYRELCAL